MSRISSTPSSITRYTLKYCIESIVPEGESVSCIAAKGRISRAAPRRAISATARAKSSTCAMAISTSRSSYVKSSKSGRSSAR